MPKMPSERQMNSCIGENDEARGAEPGVSRAASSAAGWASLDAPERVTARIDQLGLLIPDWAQSMMPSVQPSGLCRKVRYLSTAFSLVCIR
jgi:hypothetical protein